MSTVMQFIRELLEADAMRGGVAAMPTIRGVIVHCKRVYADKPEDPVIYLFKVVCEGSEYTDVAVLASRAWQPQEGEHVVFQPCTELPVFLLATYVPEVDPPKEEEDDTEVVIVPKTIGLLG